MTFSIFAQDMDVKQIQLEIVNEIAAKTNKSVLISDVAKSLKMPFPPVVPSLSIEEVLVQVNQKLDALVDEKFPLSQIELFKKESMTKFKVYKKGEQVTIRIRPGGNFAVISGPFNGFNRKGELIIGSHEIPKVDMTDELMIHFDEKLHYL